MASNSSKHLVKTYPQPEIKKGGIAFEQLDCYLFLPLHHRNKPFFEQSNWTFQFRTGRSIGGYEKLKYLMKHIIILATVFLGSSLLASDVSVYKRNAGNKRFSWDAAGPVGKISITIDKSDYELHVYDDKGWYATYPVVFGNNSLADKKMEGDKPSRSSVFIKELH